jgi:hypothetical protein
MRGDHCEGCPSYRWKDYETLCYDHADVEDRGSAVPWTRTWPSNWETSEMPNVSTLPFFVNTLTYGNIAMLRGMLHTNGAASVNDKDTGDI